MKVWCKQGSDTWFTSIDLNTNHIYVESVNSIGEQKIATVITLSEIKNHE